MGARCTPAAQWMNRRLPLPAVERLQRELDGALKHLRSLDLEIVVGRVPQDLDAVGLGQRRVVELDLHVDDVGDAGAGHLRHLVVRPDTAPDRDAVGHPGHVHSPSRSQEELHPYRFILRHGRLLIIRRLILPAFPESATGPKANAPARARLPAQLCPAGSDAAEFEQPLGALVAAVLFGALNDGGDDRGRGLADLGEGIGQGRIAPARGRSFGWLVQHAASGAGRLRPEFRT